MEVGLQHQPVINLHFYWSRAPLRRTAPSASFFYFNFFNFFSIQDRIRHLLSFFLLLLPFDTTTVYAVHGDLPWSALWASALLTTGMHVAGGRGGLGLCSWKGGGTFRRTFGSRVRLDSDPNDDTCLSVSFVIQGKEKKENKQRAESEFMYNLHGSTPCMVHPLPVTPQSPPF